MDTGRLRVLGTDIPQKVLDNETDITALQAKAKKNNDNIMLNAFRLQVQNSLTVQNMVDGIADEYEDETGIEYVESPFCLMKLEDNTDDGTGANAVTNIGTPTYTSGKLNNALTLDGSTDALNLNALEADISSDTTGSFSVWVKRGASGNADVVFSISHDTNNTAFFVEIDSSDRLNAILLNAGTVQWQHRVTGNTSTDWQHLCLVQDGVSPKFYLDGVDITMFNIATDTTQWLADITTNLGRLGCENRNGTGNVTFFNGQIDDFRYYQNKALTAEEVALIYNSGTGTESSTFGDSQNISYNSTDDYYEPLSIEIPFCHMKLEDNTDDGSGANAVTNIGTPTYTSGHLTNALTLTTDQALNVDALMNDIKTDTSGTVSCWVYFTNLSGNYQIFTLSKSDAISSRFQFRLQVSTGKIYVQATDNTGTVQWDMTSTNAISAGEWIHLTLVQDGISPKLYVNAEDKTTLGTTTDTTFWYGDESGTLNAGRIGVFRFNSVNYGFFEGKIDDFRYYQNKALTSAEVTLLHNSGNGVDKSGIPLNMTLISEISTAETEPTTARAVLLEEDVDSITINTDLKIYATKDDGVTWAQGTLSDAGNFDTEKRILVADFDFTASGIGSGSDMKYKLESANNKSLKIHATALSWD